MSEEVAVEIACVCPDAPEPFALLMHLIPDSNAAHQGALYGVPIAQSFSQSRNLMLLTPSTTEPSVKSG